MHVRPVVDEERGDRAAAASREEQITWITEGRCEVYSGGRKSVMEAGDVMIIPPNTPHEFLFTADTVDIDLFVPQGQDWIDAASATASARRP